MFWKVNQKLFAVGKAKAGIVRDSSQVRTENARCRGSGKTQERPGGLAGAPSRTRWEIGHVQDAVASSRWKGIVVY